MECVVESECVIFNVFGDSIDFVLRFMDFYLRIGAGNGINLAILLFFLEDGSLTDTHCELYCGWITLRSLLGVCGDSIFSLNLFFLIMSSKSISTFLPLCRLRTFFSYFSRFASYIFILRYSRFFSIFLI